MIARWGWYPAPGPSHADELLFPKGAEITEVDRFDGRMVPWHLHGRERHISCSVCAACGRSREIEAGES